MIEKIGYYATGFLRAFLVAIVLIPSLVVNVWPKLSLVLDGHADGNTVGMMLLFAISVPLLAGGVIAFAKAKDFGSKLIIGIVCASLALVNGGNAIDVASHVKDSFVEPRRDLINRAASIDSRITAAANRLASLPDVAPVSSIAVEAAQAKVTAASVARQQECSKGNGGVGDNCRKRVDAEQEASSALAAVLDQKSKADDRIAASDDLLRLQSERDTLGVVPTLADPWAARVATVLGAIGYPIGWAPSAEAVSNWWPNVLGFVVELIAMFGPKIVLTALPMPVVPAGHAKSSRPFRPKRKKQSLADRLVGKPNLPGEQASVRAWKKARVLDRPGQSVRCGVAYHDYVDWCREQDRTPVSLTAFGLQMKNELGVKSETVNKRSSYKGILIMVTPKLVKAAG